MNAHKFDKSYFIIHCDLNDNIVKSISKIDKKLSTSFWIGRNISKIIIKKRDTDKNVNFYEILGISNKIFNVDSFEDSNGTIYLAKEINSNEGLYFKANYDTLSKLPNRNLLNDRFNLLISQSKRANNKIAILFIDLDGFKKINDIHGHNTGDILLIEISNRLKGTIRDSDTIARWGGDEFIILLNNIDNKDSIDISANRMIKDCSKPVKIDKNLKVSISLSIGVSIYPDDSNDKVQLLELADRAMYKAKKDDTVNHFYSEYL